MRVWVPNGSPCYRSRRMNPTPADAAVVNIAAYRFALLENLRELRASLLARCKALQLKGTILISSEGINLFVAGSADSIEALLSALRGITGLEGIAAKYSETAVQPFTRMLVRIKKEIIAFGVPGIEPARYTSKRVTPRELRQWLDEGRPVTLLDTRNDYEVKLGTFRNAVPVGVDNFRNFPAAVAKLPATLKHQPVVTFCTGGIRCEKAGPYLETQGFSNVFQLDGGILKYFEECGSAHYDGDCFVFDQRVGLDPALQETSATQCFKCLAPLGEAEQADPRHVPGKSCPYCFVSDAEHKAAAIAARQAQLRQLAWPLPGSVARDNFRPVSVSQRCDGQTLLQALCFAVKHLPAEYWEQECQRRLVVDAAHAPVAADRIVRAGERYQHRVAADVEPDVSLDVKLLYEDEVLLVLDKPAPLPVHAAGRFHRNTLQYLLEALYRPQKPRPAHRLDANTTGVLVVARTRHFAGQLQPLFATGAVQKLYLVRVHGHPVAGAFACDAPIGIAAGEMGTRAVDPHDGLPARTQFEVLERQPDGSSLLLARPQTGRTNQIRIHCAHLGFPVCGDQAYRGGEAAALAQTALLTDPPLCLHAWEIAFRHPATGEELRFSAPAPAWAGDHVGLIAPASDR
ncbi:MAG: RluA family pseudouridine synthase [Pseudomonadota bacterium]